MKQGSDVGFPFGNLGRATAGVGVGRGGRWWREGGEEDLLCV